MTGGPLLGSSRYPISLWDPDGGIEFSPTRYAITESGGRVTVLVRRNDDGTNIATVDYSTCDGTARAGRDYAPQKGTLTFQPGQASATIDLPVFPNRDWLSSRTFFIELMNASREVSLGPQTSALVKILARTPSRPPSSPCWTLTPFPVRTDFTAPAPKARRIRRW